MMGLHYDVFVDCFPVIDRWTETVTIFDRLREVESINDVVNTQTVGGGMNLLGDIKFVVLATEVVFRVVVHDDIEQHAVGFAVFEVMTKCVEFTGDEPFVAVERSGNR